jgi:hypothetical protein
MSAGGVDGIFALGRAAIRLHTRQTPVVQDDRFDDRGLGESHAHLLSRVLVRLGNATRRHPTVGRAPEDGLDLTEIHRRPAAFGFCVVDELSLQPGVIGRAFELPKLFGALITQRNAERTDFMPIRLHFGPLQLPENRDRLHGQFDALRRVAHLAAQPCALRRRDLPDVIGALDQQEVGFAGLGEGVRHAAADGTAPDDDDFRVGELVHDSGTGCVGRGA